MTSTTKKILNFLLVSNYVTSLHHGPYPDLAVLYPFQVLETEINIPLSSNTFKKLLQWFLKVLIKFKFSVLFS